MVAGDPLVVLVVPPPPVNGISQGAGKKWSDAPKHQAGRVGVQLFLADH